MKRISQIDAKIKIVFKGGTSLSKCYQVIDRFSEDVDLTVDFNAVSITRGKKELKKIIVTTIDYLGMEFLNGEDVLSRRDHNIYNVRYKNEYVAEMDMIPNIMIETIVAYKPYPCKMKKVSNYITNYLMVNNNHDFLERFDLYPFEMLIQSIERTFIDKLFAICDYHLERNYQRYSRHLYDVHMIWRSGLLDLDELHSIVSDVIKDRQMHGDRNLSCIVGSKPIELLNEVIDTGIYRSDYIDITSKLIYKPVIYEECIESLKNIIQSNIIPNEIKNYQ